MRRRAVAPPMVVAALCLSALGGLSGARVTLALVTGSATVSGNTFTTGAWATATTWYLHNNPTPPVANTAAKFNLALNGTAPIASTLFNYDTGCDSLVGRQLKRTGNGVSEVTSCKYANWRTGTLAAPLAINGVATFMAWSAITGFQTGQTGSLTIYLRDFNPGTATYTEITNATLTQAGWQGASNSWVQKTITLPSVSYTLATGHQLELKVVASNASAQYMLLAYDTTAYATSLQLP
jgi:hypothetical protein